jgi:hypothetical protein
MSASDHSPEPAAASGLEVGDDSVDESPGSYIRALLPHCTKAKVLDTTKKLAKRYLIDAFPGMSQGLFVTLIPV